MTETVSVHIAARSSLGHTIDLKRASVSVHTQQASLFKIIATDGGELEGSAQSSVLDMIQSLVSTTVSTGDGIEDDGGALAAALVGRPG